MMQTYFQERFLSHFVVVGMTLLLSASSAVAATEYFVSLDGCDETQDGRSRETAFATIQKGVDALAPGDTLTILPGDYHESVRRDGLGSEDAVTTIRADIPGTVVLRGDVPAPIFERVDGPGVFALYAADFDPAVEVRTLNEMDTLLVLQSSPALSDLQFMPGTFYQDREAGRLYLTPSDNASAVAGRYRLAVRAGNGLELGGARGEVGPRQVVVEGLAATGFNAMRFGARDGVGIRLENARDCIVRDCHAWLNGWGILVSSDAEGSGNNVIERCTAWANDSMFANSRIGGLIATRHRGDVIRDSTAFLNANCGIYLRGDADASRSSRLLRNLAWGNRWDFIIKGNPGLINVTERSVAGVYSARKSADHALFLRGRRTEGEAPGTIILEEEENLDPDAEFADPVNHDYRLQASSRFRGTGPDGGDRGPHPYTANLFFVSPEGDDSADGLSVQGAWRTLQRAVRELPPGATLYLLPGAYDGPLTLSPAADAERPIRLLGRGHAPVVLRGAVTVEGSGIEFQRLHFENAVTVSGSRSVRFAQCWFLAPDVGLVARDTQDLRVTHCGFTGFADAAVALEACRGAHLSGNLYDNRAGPAVRLDAADAVRYADYNAFRDPAMAWALSGAPVSLADAPGAQERYSVVLPAAFTVRASPMSLTERPVFAASGPLGNPFGPFQATPRQVTLRLIRDPYVHALGATTADIEWGNLLPSRVHVAWGSTPAVEHRDVLEADYFGRYSLTGLEPDQPYYFRIERLEESGRPVGQHDSWRPGTMQVSGAAPEGGLLRFTTRASDPEPTDYWVAPDGDDANSGLDRANAWGTLQHAADRVRVGDTVWIAGGTYEEQVRIRASGAPGAPIRFGCAPGEQVILSAGAGAHDLAFGVFMKHHLHFDGMYLLGKGFDLNRANDITLSRMFAGVSGGGYAPGLLNALSCNRLTVQNSVMLNAKGGPGIHDSSEVRIENCVFFRNMISQLGICTLPGRRIELIRNIFTDGLAKKFSASMINLARFDAVTLRDNCFFPRRDPEQKNIVMLYSDAAFERCRLAYAMGETDAPHPHMEAIVRLSFPQIERYFGETGSLLANPEFAGAADLPRTTEAGHPIYAPDRMVQQGIIPMNRFFATHPELVERGIGLQPEAFADFHFHAAFEPK